VPSGRARMVFVQITFATEATPGRVNEDFVAAGADWALVLDGATPRADVDGGCAHGPAWLVRRLGGRLAQLLAEETGAPLRDVLAEAIGATAERHAGTCDLGNPDSPSATVAMLRTTGAVLEWLVLADSAVVLDVGGTVRAMVDDRVAHLPGYTVEAVRAARNNPGGFWVASTRPEAAYEAMTGSVETARVRRAALFSDGAARLVERFGVTDWSGLLDLLDRLGPVRLIERTRTAERAETDGERAARRGKRHDDATVVALSPDAAAGQRAYGQCREASGVALLPAEQGAQDGAQEPEGDGDQPGVLQREDMEVDAGREQ
jgi:hypothetical protein